jgi:TonB-linked SusC/RagA family outer membrane protein
MKKIKMKPAFIPAGLWKSRLLKIMRLTVVICIIALSQSFAGAGYSQSTRISLQEKNATLRVILEKIENQSDFYFMYNGNIVDVNQKVSVKADKVLVTELLDQVLQGTGITYRIDNRQIALTAASESGQVNQVQQIKTVNGKVTDSNGAPLPGVTVAIKGTTQGTITDVNGNYFFTNVPGNAILVFSFVGMKTQEISVSGKTNMNVILEEETIGIEEVVAVGYGTQKRESLTGAISIVKDKDLIKASNNDITNSLTGRAPGIRIVQMSSEPGKFDSQIDIRGFSYTDPNDNIAGNQTGGPLFIVDGVQRDKAGFDRLDPNEIESISVLKDASAAIYGVKAANGVILVTTKKGKSGRLEVDYTGQFGYQLITRYPEMSTAYQYAVMHNEMQINEQISTRAEITQPRFTAEEIEAFRTGKARSTDFLGLIMRNSAPQQQHNITLTGGNDKIKYFASGGYFDEQGLFTSDILWAKKYNFRINVRAELASGLDMGVNVALINSMRNRTQTDTYNIISNTFRKDPTESVYANDNPLYLTQFRDGLDHPLAQITQEISGYYYLDEKFLTSTFDLNYNIPFIKGLNVKALYAYDVNYSNRKAFNKKWNQYEYLYDSSVDNYYYKEFTHSAPSSLSEVFSEGTKNHTQLSLNYNNTFGNHNFTGLLLYEQVERLSKNFTASTQFVIDAVDHLYAGDRAKDAVNSGYSESANRSYVGRVNYNYSSKYFAEFAFRYDGSSLFPRNSRWGFFPSTFVGWRISEEPFVKNNLPMLTNLKIRSSYGVLGDDGASSFQWLTGYTYPSSITSGYQFGTTWTRGLDFKNSANPNITWYTATMSNIGLDGSLWNDLLYFELDLFRRDRDGLLAVRNASYPATFGVNLPQENLNEDRTQGYEIVLGHRNKIREVSYSVAVNMSYARTQNRYKEETPASSNYDYWRNKNANRYNDVVWGYKTDGQFQSFEEIYSAPVIDGAGNRTLLPGDLRYVDMNGDGVINTLDQVVIGRGQSKPSVYFGADLGLAWKNFDFSILLQGATMYQVFYSDQLSRPFFWGTANPINEFWDRWHREDVFDPNSKWIPGKYPSTGARQNYAVSDFWLRNATYLRVKNIVLGYSLPKRISNKINIDNLRIFVSGYNVYTWTAGLDFVDPEYTDDRYYSYNYPITMNLNLGVQLNF